MRKSLLPFLLLLLGASAAEFPPVPPLPAGSWPSSADAEPFARALLDRVPADAVAEKLIAEPDSMPAILRNLGTALLSRDTDFRERLARYAGAVARAAAARTADVRALTAIVIVDPLRYGDDPAFRAQIDSMLPQTMAGMPHASAVLDELNASAGIDFDTAEAIAFAAELAPRRSATEKIAFDRGALTFPDDLSGPIAASFYSLSSAFFKPDEAKRFLDAVHRVAPKRRLVVLADAPMRSALAAPYVTFIDAHERAFTPWPRDPFLVARDARGGIAFVNRPNVQPHREEDRNMVRAIVDGFPERATWTVAPFPFHNGNVLLTPHAAWITMHSVETRALAILGIDRVPVERFGDKSVVAQYERAVRQAAEELRDFYGKPVRFVHALPNDATRDVMNRLGGGAGIDLDSIVTLLPKRNGATDALVGDLALGARIAKETSDADWEGARRAYGWRDDRARFVDAQRSPHAIALQAFLDEIASELRRDGITVRRLPLLEVPPSLVARDEVAEPYLVTWNNVVLEQRGSARRAEGFSSLLPRGDERARRAFAEAGYTLDFLPPLMRSVELGGGYRCASNHAR